MQKRVIFAAVTIVTLLLIGLLYLLQDKKDFDNYNMEEVNTGTEGIQSFDSSIMEIPDTELVLKEASAMGITGTILSVSISKSEETAYYPDFVLEANIDNVYCIVGEGVINYFVVKDGRAVFLGKE